MKKLGKIGSIASIAGATLAVVGLINVNAASEYFNNNQNISGNVFNQPSGSIHIDNRETTTVTTNVSKTVSTHDGAGAILMIKPDFKAFVSIERHNLHIGRLINGTELKVIRCEDFSASKHLKLQVPWCKVEILEGDFSTRIGWLPSANIVKI